MIPRAIKNKMGIAVFLSSSIIFIILHIHLFNPQQENVFDASENLVASFTIAKHNTYSINLEPHPSSKREPLFPLLVGTMIKFKSLFVDHALDLNLQSLKHINRLKILNISFLFITILLACLFVQKTTQKYGLVLYTAITLVFSSALAESAHTFCTEILAALLCLMGSSLLYFAKKWRFSRPYYIGLALTISALVMTKAIFLYFIPIVLTYLLWINYQKKVFFDRNFIINLLILSSCIAMLVGGWMLRNYHYNGRFAIAERREVLNTRAAYDSISSAEYPYLYVVWAPGLNKYFLHKNNEPDWTRLVNRLGNDQVILDVFQNQISNFFHNKKLNSNGSFDQSDYIELEKLALQHIINHPLAHLKLSLAFLYRSVFIEDGGGLEYLGFKLPHDNTYDKRVDNFLLALIVNIPIWLCFIYCILYSILKRDVALGGLILLPTYTVLMYSCVVFSHPRYMLPLVPVLTVIFCLALAKIWENVTGAQKNV